MNNNEFKPVQGTFEENATKGTEEENTKVAVIGTADDGSNLIVDLTSRRTSFCSIVADTEEKQDLLFHISNSPDFKLADEINLPIEVKDVFVEVVFCAKQGSDVKEPAPRIVLVDSKGKGHQAVSLGIYGGVKKLFEAYGTPDKWSKPKKLIVKSVTKGEKKILTLDIAK